MFGVLFVFVYSTSDAYPSESSAWTAARFSCLLQLSFECFDTYAVRSEHQNTSVCIDFMHSWVNEWSKRAVRAMTILHFILILLPFQPNSMCCPTILLYKLPKFQSLLSELQYVSWYLHFIEKQKAKSKNRNKSHSSIDPLDCRQERNHLFYN